MALLLDNDVVYKLAQLDLLMEAKQILNKDFGELKVLDTLRFKFCPKKEISRTKSEKKYGTKAISKIEEFLNSGISEISQTIDDDILKKIIESDIQGFDEGELRLLQALLNEKDQLLFTGDKRFLQALTNVEFLQDKLKEIQQKFVCFEQIVFFLIQKLSFQTVNCKFIENINLHPTPIDSTLRICFGTQRENTAETVVIENLTHYIEDLKMQTGTLLFNFYLK